MPRERYSGLRRELGSEPLAADRRPAALEVGPAQALDDRVRARLGHLDEREAVRDLDRADVGPGELGLAGDRADDVLRADPGAAAHADEQPRHPLRGAARLALLGAAGALALVGTQRDIGDLG